MALFPAAVPLSLLDVSWLSNACFALFDPPDISLMPGKESSESEADVTGGATLLPAKRKRRAKKNTGHREETRK